MPAQDRGSKKNYIGILNHRVDEDALVKHTLVRSDRPMKNYLLGLMATVLNRNTDAGEPLSEPTLAPPPGLPSID
jgi:hypothetical protein